jgi:hypothetical protein
VNTEADKVVEALNRSDGIFIWFATIQMIILVIIPLSLLKRFDSSQLFLLWSVIAIVAYAVVVRFRQLKIASLLETALQSEGSPSRGTSLRLIELLYSRFLTIFAKERVIELVLRGEMEELVLHQETMLRFATRWLNWTWRKDSPLNRFAANLAFCEGSLPEELQERIEAKLLKLGVTLSK